MIKSGQKMEEAIFSWNEGGDAGVLGKIGINLIRIEASFDGLFFFFFVLWASIFLLTTPCYYE